MSDPRVLLVVAAASGAGKTTLLERLIPALAARGVRCAAVKLTHHDVDPDPAGKDSRRLRDAGAAAAVLGGPRVTSVFVPQPRSVAALARLAAAAADVDLVLVEGGRDEPDLPRIEIVPAGAAAISDTALLVAVVGGDGSRHGSVPAFRRDDIDALAGHVAAWIT